MKNKTIMPTSINKKGDEVGTNQSSATPKPKRKKREETSAGKPKKKASKQAVKTCAEDLSSKHGFMKEVENMFRKVMQKPALYDHAMFQHLRAFCEYRDNNRKLFSGLMGETPPLQPNNGGVVVTDLSPGYIHAIANYHDTTIHPNPILQVVSGKTKYRSTPFKQTCNKPQQPVKITHLRLLDGDNNTMMGRLAMSITDMGKKLKEGDIIRLEQYTELTHTLNVKENAPRKPVVYIIKFSLVGYNPLPLPKSILDPMECPSKEVIEKSNHKTVHIDSVEDVECNGSCCSLYGIRMLVCVRKTNPIGKINLQTLKDECWFADKEVDGMSNSEKRCMLYWWFATNIYGICGSKNRAPLPVCLVASVRKEYPEPDGKYTGYEANRYIGEDASDV